MATTEQRIARNRAYVDERRAATVCERCGAQPIEWHNPAHEGHRNRQVSHLAAITVSIARIAREIEESTALCRSCHMATDGRAQAFAELGATQRQRQPPQPCAACGRPSNPLRQGKCRRCYDADRYASGQTTRQRSTQ